MSRDFRRTVALLSRLAKARNLDAIVDQLPEGTRHGIGAAINRSLAARMFDKLDKDKNKLISSDELKGHVIFKQVNWDKTAGLNRSDFIHQFAALRRGAYSDAIVSSSEAVASGPVSLYQYMLLSLKAGIPFLAFGFVDNFIMVIAGDTIEMSLGAAFTLSTMAAAGLGNAISDAVGVGASDVIEAQAARLGLPAARLTAEQLQAPTTRMVTMGAQMVAIVVGCVIGLCPLLFLDQEEKRLRESFDDVDINKDGHLSIEEITVALNRYGIYASKEKVEAFVAKSDKDKDKRLSFEEYKDLIRRAQEAKAQGVPLLNKGSLVPAPVTAKP